MLEYAAGAVGAVGATLIVAAYWLLQTEKIQATSVAYSAANLAGAALLLTSLLVNFNLGSVMIELFWLGISAYGLHKALKPGRAARRKGEL